MSEKWELGVMETSTERQRGETVSLIIKKKNTPKISHREDMLT